MSDEADFARTMRIDLGATKPLRDERSHTVTIHPSREGVGATSFDLQSQQNLGDDAGSSYNRLLQSIYDAVLITDSEGTVLECNQRAIDFLGYSHRDLLRLRIVRIICGVDDAVLASIRKSSRITSIVESYCNASRENISAGRACNPCGLLMTTVF